MYNSRIFGRILIILSIYLLFSILVKASFTSASDTVSNSRFSEESPMLVQSAVHTLTFTTSISVNNPVIQVRVPASNQTSTSNDGYPDFGSAVNSSGFDLDGMVAGDVTCSAAGPSWVASVTPSTSSGGNFHIITCTGTGVLSTQTTMTITIGSAAHKLINPAPTSGHIIGKSDVYGVAIRELDATNNLLDSTVVKVGPVDGVVVSATVPNTLTFSISGVDSGSPCGKTLSTKTTSSTVPFPNITTGKFFNAANLLTVSTNAIDGYSVTVQENGPLSISGSNGTVLADTNCPLNNCSVTTPGDWTSSDSSGFGYSLQNSSGNDASFQYNDLSRTFNSKPFSSTAVETVMANKGPVDGSAVNICYQISASLDQRAGYYSNQLTYVAAPSF